MQLSGDMETVSPGLVGVLPEIIIPRQLQNHVLFGCHFVSCICVMFNPSSGAVYIRGSTS